MRKFKKLTMTLALLITAVSGAWAQSSPNVVELEEVPAEWETDQSYLTAGDLTGFKTSTLDEVKAWTGAPAEGTVWLIYAFDGDDAYYVRFDNGAPFSAHSPFQKNMLFGYWKSNLKIYYTAEPEITEWSLTPDETGKNWTLAEMPASNVELQVEYFAESNLFLSKEALADKGSINVKAGDLGVQFGEDGKSANTVTEGSAMTVTYSGSKKVIDVTVKKKEAVDPAKAYLKWDADQKKMVATEIPTTATKVENANADVSWQAGTYVVEGDVTINGSITLNGEVNLIIKDGAKLTAQGIRGESNNLNIYGQANQSGQLVVDNSGSDAISNITTLEVHSAKVTATSSASYCGGFFNLKTFNVYGGSVDAKCTGSNGFGTGLMENGSMNIYGGEVKAEGKGSGGIFYFHNDNKKPTVTVYGGKLWAGCTNKALYYINLTKDASYTSGKIETSADNSAWTEYTEAATPTTKYVRVGY